MGAVSAPAGGVQLLIDPDGLDQVTDAVIVTDRWRLRQLLEQVASRTADDPPILIHLQVPGLRTSADLPFDARPLPHQVIDLRASAAVVAEARKLPRSVMSRMLGRGPLSQRAVRAAAALADLAWPVGQDLQVVAAIRLADLGPQLRAAVASTLPTGWLRQTLMAPDPLAIVAQEAQQWWEHGTHPQLEGALQAAATDLKGLVTAGAISPPLGSTVAAAIPADLRAAVVHQQSRALLGDYLETLGGDLPQDLAGWRRLANDWATIRRLLTQLPLHEVDEWQISAWERWAEIDQTWTGWLRREYGLLLSRSALNPVGVHHTAPFLAHRGAGSKHPVLLLVLDGLGLSQWQLLQQSLHLEVREEHRILASLPTITSVSRQAIFAGKLPNDFAEHSESTAHESAHWLRFWTERGLRVDQVHYEKTAGSDANDWRPPRDGVQVSGLAVSAPDKLLHGSEVFGDRQLSKAIVDWAGEGYLTAAIDWCHKKGVHLWIASDHGNLPTTDNDFQSKNLTRQRVGHRVAFYSKEVFGQRATRPDVMWTPPGFGRATEDLGFPYFAHGRQAFTAASHIVAHGGLSIDEVIVPLVRIV